MSSNVNITIMNITVEIRFYFNFKLLKSTLMTEKKHKDHVIGNECVTETLLFSNIFFAIDK